MKRLRRFMNHADQVVGKFGELLKKQYGFLTDPALPLWKNVERRLGEMSLDEWSLQISNMSCRTTCCKVQPYHLAPRNSWDLDSITILSTTANTYNRMIEDVRKIYHLKDAPDNDDYSKQLYINKSDYVFDPASNEIEEAVSNFSNAIKTEQLRRSHRKKPIRNLTRRQWELVKFFKNHDRYIIIFADKNLGPCILERTYYILRGCTDITFSE
eukprot:scaffold70892_cov59-Cyclotella_meneghiniana.AAC.1